MARKLLIVAALALVQAVPALAQPSDRSLLMPGVTYTRDVEFTPHGPVVLHVVNAPRPGGLYSLVPLLSNEAIVGDESVTQMEKRYSASMTTVGVNGDLFNARDGQPTGIVIRNGVLDHGPARNRSSIGVTGDGSLRVDRVELDGFWKGSGQRRPIALNATPSANGVSLFTPAWGPTTPTIAGVEAVIRPLARSQPNVDLVGSVVQLGQTQGSTAIPPDGAVLQARGSAAAHLAAEAAVGGNVTIRLTLTPSWSDVVNALGGGPLIVRGGKPVFNAGESFTPSQLSPRSARAAVGQRADGRILLVAVDGKQPGYSAGMTNLELALALMRLGAVTASALGSGSASSMAFDGQLLSHPATAGGEAAVAEALVVGYAGVYVPPPSEDVLSPNGDGISDKQQLAYKLVRASTVQASLVAPDKTTRQLDAGQRAPGVYRFTWPGTSEPEGQWRFTVAATDDQGQSSTADRLFSLNDTLASLTVRPAGRRLSGTVNVAHPAQLTVTVETASNIVLRVLARRRVQPGTFSFSWDGRDGAKRVVSAGNLQVHVVADNDLGRVELRTGLRARR